MSGILLTGGTCGCPPTETPPAGYQNHARVDDGGCLWFNSCYSSFKFVGAARHDIGTSVVIGPSPGTAPVSTESDIVSGNGVTSGTFNTITVTNNTECTLGLLLGMDLSTDTSINQSHLMKVVLSSRWNGAPYSSISTSNTYVTGSTAIARQLLQGAANPHDTGIEGGGAANLTLAPGASGVVGAKIFLQYVTGASDGIDQINQSFSSIRVYSYVL